MKKQVRKAVRTLLLKENKVVAIKYEIKNKDFYDLPGGGIEGEETSYEASIREFKEETGIIIKRQKCIGNAIVEYPNRIFDFTIYLVEEFDGAPKDFLENSSFWITIEELLKEEKLFPTIEILKYRKEENISLKFLADENHKLLNVENKKNEKQEKI